MQRLRVVIADDERPARAFLRSVLASYDDVAVVGEASNGAESDELIERLAPDLALLDLQMPEVHGLDVVRLLRKTRLPLVAFVTAYDEHAVRAFELNAVDYLLKPVEPSRLRQTINRAIERLEHANLHPGDAARVRAAATQYDATAPAERIRRIPVRSKDEILLIAVSRLASIVADGELLHLTTVSGERYVITYALKDLEARLDPANFVRLSRGALVNVDTMKRVTVMPGGTYLVTLTNGETLTVSRLRSRVLRDQLLKL